MPVICPHCSREFPGDRLNARHLAKCAPTSSPTVAACLCGHESTSLTQMKRHRKDCVAWQSRDAKAVSQERKKATSIARHGVADATQSSEARAKRASTNVERYGSVNPFSRESSVFNKVQASLDGKRPVLRGEDNPFARSEVKEKIRATMRERHGAESPQQVPEIRARTKATSHARYGGELLGSPILAAKARATNEAKYGDAFPQRTDEVKERQRETNLAKWGVPWTGMHPEVRQRQIDTHHARYGGHWFASEEGKAKVREAMVSLYGVDHPAKMDGWWERLRATFQERYRVTHPLQLAVFLDKQRATNEARYGTPFPGLRFRGPNGLEQKLLALVPPGSLMFTGDGKFWRMLPALGHNKNPDFVVPGPDPEHPKRGVTKVVEAFGDFWHSRMFTGRVPFEHESELVDAYAAVGIECLVVWESEVKADPERVRARLSAFLGDGLSTADMGRGDVLDLFG